MNRIFKNFLKKKLKKKIFLKNEIKKKILKSIIQNQNVNFFKKQFAYYLLIKKPVYCYKQKNTCLLTGRNSSVSNYFFISRHFIKKNLNINKLQNVKINSW